MDKQLLLICALTFIIHIIGTLTGGATVMMAVFIDPHMSGMTDDVIEGKIEESQFRRAVVWLMEMVIAQFLLMPSRVVIVDAANTYSNIRVGAGISTLTYLLSG